MIHNYFLFLCALQHDTIQKSIIKAKYKTFQLKHFILKNSLLSCCFDIEDVINDFLKRFYLNLNTHYRAKIAAAILA